MKRILTILLVLSLTPALAYAAQEAESRVYVVRGEVIVKQGNYPAHRVVKSELLVSDTLVKTGKNSAALLKFKDGQVVTLQSNSTFMVRKYRYDPRNTRNSNIVFSVFRGGARFLSGLIGKHSPQAFRLSTPNVTIGIRGTEFMVAMTGKSMYGKVLSGRIEMTNAGGTAVVGAGQSVAVASPNTLASVIAASTVPSGIFGELLSIPTNPSAIPSVPEPAETGTGMDAGTGVGTGVGAGAGAAASMAGATIGAAGGILAGGMDSDSEEPQVAPVTETREPVKGAMVSDQEEMRDEGKSGTSFTAKIGSLGYGGELNFGGSDSYSSRVGVNAFFYKFSGKSYDFKWKMQSASAIVDWYPFEGSFRTSFGLFYDNNKVTLKAKPTGTSYDINGVTYSTSQLGMMKATMTFNKAAPYIGMGWGNPVSKDKGWGLTTEIGALYHGSPRIDLEVTCNDALVCTQLQADAEAEKIKLQNDFSKLKWWPVISMGISYQW